MQLTPSRATTVFSTVRGHEHAEILNYCRSHGIPFFAYMLEQGTLSGKYSPENPLPEGTNRAQAYNGMLLQLKALTDKLASIGEKHGAAASDIATASGPSPRGRRRLSASRSPTMWMVWSEPVASRLPARIEELESLADAARVDTRGWWEKEM